MKLDAVQRIVHSMPNVHDILEIRQGGQNLHATQKESSNQGKQMRVRRYISDTEEIVKASGWLFQHDIAAAFNLSERSPLPLSLAPKDLPGGRTHLWNVLRIRRIHHHAVERDEDSAPVSISDTKYCLNWNCELDNSNDREDHWAADAEYDIEQDNGIKEPEWPEPPDVSATPNVPRLIRPTRKSNRQAEKVSVTVNAMEMRRNKGIKKTVDRMHQCFTSFFM